MLARRLALLVATLAPAVTSARSATGGHGFVVDQWTTEDGLPLDHAVDVAFTPDGFVWIATFEGLVRFDGVHFQPSDDAWISALGTRRIARVATHPRDGALWIMAEQRAVARYTGGELQVWDTRELGGVPLKWRVDADTIWLSGDGGVHRLEDRPVRPSWAEGRGASGGVAVAPDGAMMFSAEGAIFRVRADGEPERLGVAHGVDEALWFLETAADGTPVAQTGQRFFRWNGVGFVALAEDDASGCSYPTHWGSHTCPPRGAPGSPWRISSAAITFEGREVWPLHGPAERAILDPRGDLWVPTRGDGLVRVRPSVVRHLSIGSADPRVDHVWIDGADRLWARHAADVRWTVFDPEDRLRGSAGVELDEARAFAREFAPDRVLFLGRRLLQVSRFDGEALQVESQVEIGIPHQCTDARMADGTRVIGGNSGLFALTGASLVSLGGQVEELRVRALEPLGGGALAIGTLGQGLLVLDSRRELHAVGQRDALLVDNIRHLRRDGDTLWVSTEDEGLCAVGPLSGPLADAGWRCLRPARTVRGVHASETDDLGRTWLSSNFGLWVTDTRALVAFAAGGPAPAMLQLGADAGMKKAEANGPYCGTVARDRAGVLWFPTQDGVVGADPARFRFPAAPQVYIDPPRLGSPVLEAEQPLRLTWTAPAPEYAHQVVFRVRLGDSPWSEANGDRGVTLAELPPGPFRVEVQAGLAGAWGPVASFSGVRQAAWYEGPIPWVLGGLLAIALGAGVVRLRTRTLRRRQWALEAEVTERTAEVRSKADALMKQSARLAELEGLRTRAIVNLHHELRTPLTLVMTGLERLRRPAEAQEQVNHERVMRNADRLQALMGQLADIARLEAGEVVPRARRLDLRAQVAAIVGRFQGLAAERGVTLVPPPVGAELPVWLDPDILDKILGNIVHNALKFTPSGGAVSVGLFDAGERVRVEVDDTGPGVPAHARERVFERLYQVEREDDRSHEGSGVGLALARELTELCGGEIGNLPREGGGTRFWFTLPRGSAALLPEEVAADAGVGEGAAPQDAVIVGPEDAPLLLVVEDHVDMRAWFVEELSEGFRVATAADGEQGLDRATSLRPALVVSDVMMPRLDGLALARALRERQGAPPVLLISAKASTTDRAAALAVADGWLAKPFSSTALRDEVRRLVRVEPTRAQPREPNAAPTLEVDRRLLDRLTVAVDARLADESFGVPDLARAVATSERTLYRELARIAGVTPSRWIREHRLRRAAEMLRRGEYRTVSEVAAAVGMSRAWFTRMYRAWCGNSPSEDIPAGK